ncbi:MAG: DUF6356 family protein [Erythrobacter sp.]|nr:DUF6356 family protein [Erythrobacter sp.]
MPDWHAAFTRHPASVGESYAEHALKATGFGLRMIGCGLACLVHALLPFLFERTASRAVDRLHNDMVTDRRTPDHQLDFVI